ncbi:MAG: hypoxanthine phosphoribosyltransferase [Actinomycetota bacterium]|jgi:hypoxanthine phosphoribosyltransferase|nr:hypoxanthine phosphoribosyltransferase [Actinomycetota bacterium]MEA2487184.1 hypoxanthine phosphoribosyltransferase [Actinomycetota bacterium]
MPEVHPDIDKILISAEEIQDKISDLAKQVTEDYRGRDLLLVGVLKGAFVFMADLARGIQLPLEFDFMAVSSYGSATKSSGVVRILKDLDYEITDRHVLLVEDIIDSGLTISYLLRYLEARRPASLEICSLFWKRGEQAVPLQVRYPGFEIPPVFVVGYGLDYAEKYRNLPYIGVLKPQAYGVEKPS